ncbi:MAG: 2-oxo acid dehydrogenase subunit E2 [Eubacteriaceae bacterium]|nr:2-oxo acid dehydrogenase subunit E2 [Eubacteriaceae bacterium]
MAMNVVLPDMGKGMATGIITRWFKNEGERIRRGEALYEVRFDSGKVKVSANASGYLLQIKQKEGKAITSEDVLGIIGDTEEIVEKNKADADEIINQDERLSIRGFNNGNHQVFDGNGRSVRATPAARRYAREQGVNLDELVGCGLGAGGRILPKDIDRFLEQKKIFEKFQNEKKKNEESKDSITKVEEKKILESEPQTKTETVPEEKKPETLRDECQPETSETETPIEESASAPQEEPEIAPTPIALPKHKEINISPLAEAMAAENDIDIHHIKTGTGPGGKIVKSDIQKIMADQKQDQPEATESQLSLAMEESIVPAKPVEVETEETPLEETETAQEREDLPVETQEPDPVVEETLPEPEETEITENESEKSEDDQDDLTTLEAVTAHHSQTDKAVSCESPVGTENPSNTTTLSVEVDVTELRAYRKKVSGPIEKETGLRCAYTDFLIQALAKTLAACPKLVKGSAQDINIALMVKSDDGLVTPVFRKTDTMALSQIVVKRCDFMKGIRCNRFSKQDFEGASFKIMNLGMYHIHHFALPVVSGDCPVLCVGAIEDRLRYIKGEATRRKVMTVTLCLNAGTDGGVNGAEFLKKLRDFMENPTASF